MPLAPIASVDRSTLRWLRTGGTLPEYTLLAGETAVAVVRFAHRTGAAATAEIAEGTWSLDRRGFLGPHLTVRKEPNGSPVARLTNRLGHHEIEVGGGGVYRVKRAGLLLPAWTVTDSAGRERLHVEAAAEHRRLQGGAVLATGELPARELLLLVVLSWYLIALLWVEDEAIEVLVPFEGPDAPSTLGASGT